jgi:Mn2+/Fe2+ NRAMP family transporter
MAAALEPTRGRWARSFFSLGLFAAGLSSAITAPLAAAYAAAGALGWGADLRCARVRALWGVVLGCGIAFALSGPAPVPAIVFAQAANGILLPVIVAFLLWAVNDRAWLGPHSNGWRANAAGVAVLAIALFLGVRSLARALLS